MDSNGKQTGNGSKDMESRAAFIGGRLKWYSNSNRGTTVVFVGKVEGVNKFLHFFKKAFNLKNS